MRGFYVLTAWFVLVLGAWAAKPKVITFGRWTSVKWMVGTNADIPLDLKIRPLLVNGELKEFTTGEAHDVTDRMFVVRTADRINDFLPTDDGAKLKWRWQPSGWIVVNRTNTHVTKLALPEFDPFYSSVTWYGEYAAYCGLPDNAEQLYAIVAQVGRKKPVLKKFIGTVKNSELPDSECDAPVWQKRPVRVTFRPKAADPITFSVHGHATDLMPDEPQVADEEEQ